MAGLGRKFLVTLVAVVLALGISTTTAAAAPPCTTVAGLTTCADKFADGAKYLIEVPANWNHTLLLYSHGYVTPGPTLTAVDVGDPGTRAFLLSQGFALAGSSYASNGWALQDAFTDQITTLDTFAALIGKPKQTIAWGHSLGGIITAGLLQRNPGRFDAALPMCGVVAGGVGVWNEALDGEFVLKTLLAPTSTLQLVHITNPTANLNLSETILGAAQQTPQGRARIALAAAVGDLPGWFTPLSSEPAAKDFATQELNQFLWLSKVDGPFVFALRAELELRAGGNPSWNTGVDYEEQLARSIDRAEVRALYKQAGLSLEDDLDALAAAPRVHADAGAVDYLTKYIAFNGNLSGKPVLTIHTTGDGLVLNSDEQAYRSVVSEAENSRLLRQAFVHRAGHCTFTPAETVAALQALLKRLKTGRWDSMTTPTALNAAATALGPSLNVFLVNNQVVPAGPSYIPFEPARFLRPFDLRGED